MHHTDCSCFDNILTTIVLTTFHDEGQLRGSFVDTTLSSVSTTRSGDACYVQHCKVNATQRVDGVSPGRRDSSNVHTQIFMRVLVCTKRCSVCALFNPVMSTVSLYQDPAERHDDQWHLRNDAAARAEAANCPIEGVVVASQNPLRGLRHLQPRQHKFHNIITLTRPANPISDIPSLSLLSCQALK